MRFTITRENLQEGVAAVSKAIPARTTIPVLKSIEIEADADGVVLRANDLNLAVKVRLPAEVEQIGTMVVHGPRLLAATRELPPAPVLVAQAGDEAMVRCGRAHWWFPVTPPEDLVPAPEVSFADAWRISGSVLSALSSGVAFATSKDDSRPILSGVLWELGGRSMAMVATDGHRLVRMEIPTEETDAPPPDADLILYPRALDVAAGLFGGDPVVEVACTENHLAFRARGAEVTCRLIEGPYPAYRNVLPRDNDQLVILERAAFSAALRRAGVVVDGAAPCVALELGGAMMRIGAATPDAGRESEELPVEYDGEPMRIGFNPTYLLEHLKHIPSEEISVAMAAPNRAVLLRALGNEDAPDVVHLLMPRRLSDEEPEVEREIGIQVPPASEPAGV